MKTQKHNFSHMHTYTCVNTRKVDVLNHSTQQLQAVIDNFSPLLAAGEKRERDEAQSNSVEAEKKFRAALDDIKDHRSRVCKAKQALATARGQGDRAARLLTLSTARSLLDAVYSVAEELHKNIRPLSLKPPVQDCSWKRRTEDLMK